MSLCDTLNQIRVCSFNCTGFKSSIGYVTEGLLGFYDIILFQETWLMPHEIHIPGTISEDYKAFATSAIDVSVRWCAGAHRGVWILCVPVSRLR